MKVIVTQENLSKALNVVSRAASTKTSLPVLSNILLRTDENRLLLAATNLELANTQMIGAKISSEGAITVPSRLMSDFISNLPKDNVELHVEGTKLHITSGRYKSTINGVSADEFPALPQLKEETSLTIPSHLFKQAIAQTVITASHDDTRPVLTGVLCHTADGALYLAATDGYRLAERKLLDTKAELRALIPATALNEASRVLPDDCDEVVLSFDDSQVRFQMQDIAITSRLIEGSYPDYRQLIPKETDIKAVVAKQELIRITKIASLFARESGGSITIHTDETKGLISIHSIASQLGENTSETEAEVNREGSVTLNSRYLIEALNCFEGDKVVFGFSGKLAPCVLRGVNSTDQYQHIVMPLRS